MDPQERTGHPDHRGLREHPMRPVHAMLRKVLKAPQGPKAFKESWDRKVSMEKPVFSVKPTDPLDRLAQLVLKEYKDTLGQQVLKEKRVHLVLLVSLEALVLAVNLA